MDLNIDFEVPNFLIHHYYASGSISVLLNGLVIYLLIFHNGKIGSFKFYLLSFQISCVLLDLHVTMLMQPVGLLPICAGYSNGILSKVFKLHSHILMTLFVFFLSLQINTLIICFLRKHKAIMNLRSTSSVPNWIYHVLLGMIVFLIWSLTFTLSMSSESYEKQLEMLDIFHPLVSTKFRNLPEFQYYYLNTWMLIFFTLTIFETMKSFLMVSGTVTQMYRALKEVECQLSSQTLAKHKSALRSLIAQFATTPVAILPGGMIACTVIFPTEYSQKISWCCMMVMTTHSTLNSLVVILTYPEFRKIVCFWDKSVKKSTAVATVII
ncbi:G_PROTEIN_RECEP_F1_2 domain-containing protein [Caenorhabditis elegans]|uniref:G_PROTEIN_RECEP_F1_2 domain-containing protein n=1 Tax=Caenorhabditis elegans TaxID=6239 RepID=O17658_CAEEL|nr:G_PROTEIN_RECEP_F1_2 domain-containing protein [Caenorhabditis elegans]CAB02830.2 G_PROTEIN_RECEP_F1_2 domain-containing protein [Caenorhabditis elegans]|eukprot:NP_506760.1 Serpentine Receptor, class I [Caenorhabditis elegans]